MRRASTVLVACLAVLFVTAPGRSAAELTSGCSPTIPPRGVARDAGRSAAAFNHGGARLRVHLFWPAGTLRAGALPDGGTMATVDDAGRVHVKLGWWRGVAGTLRIGGRRLDRPAAALRAHVPSGYGPRGFQPSGLVFPGSGCWEVVGRVGPARLRFVVRVVLAGRK